MKKKRNPGRPKKFNKDLKKTRSIRTTDNQERNFKKRYGSRQEAIDHLIKLDDKRWAKRKGKK